MTAPSHPPLSFLPWLVVSLAVHAAVLAWPQERTTAAVTAEAADESPLQVQLLRAAASRPGTDVTTAAGVDAASAPSALQVTAAPPASSLLTDIPTRRAQPSSAAPVQSAPASTAAAPVRSARRIAPPHARGAVEGVKANPSRSSEDAAAWAELLSLLHQAINHHKRYPQSALHLRREGAARIDFRLGPDGRIDDLNIGSSSGVRALDLAAFHAVQAIAPFTDADRYLDRAQRFQVDVVFRIH
jgi:TonB family protein